MAALSSEAGSAKNTAARENEVLTAADASEFFEEPASAAEPDAGAATDGSDGDLNEAPRITRAGLGPAGQQLLPYWFAASGIALGVGGVLQDKPLAGACGAVAGVTAGLLYQVRARRYQRQADSLRDRLRQQRTESETIQAELRESLRTLRTEVWELRLAQQVAEVTRKLATAQPPMEVRAAAEVLATQPLDVIDLPFASRELHDQPEAGEPAAVESSAVLAAAAEALPEAQGDAGTSSEGQEVPTEAPEAEPAQSEGDGVPSGRGGDERPAARIAPAGKAVPKKSAPTTATPTATDESKPQQTAAVAG